MEARPRARPDAAHASRRPSTEIFERGRKAAIAAAERVGGCILEVGVGSGISLPDYSSRNRIFGVDISEVMLRKARERVSELSLTYVEGLAVMDARNSNFPTHPSMWWSPNTSGRLAGVDDVAPGGSGAPGLPIRQHRARRRTVAAR